MSRRKQQSIESASRIAQANREAAGKQTWRRRLLSPIGLLGIGICLLLALGMVGAAATANRSSSAANPNSDSLFGKLFASASTAAPAAPLPTPSPTPQLAKEYIYAGGRMLAVEDAGTAASAVQPADLVVWRPASGTWFIKDSGKDGLTGTGVFGTNGDKPVQGDFDGDGLYDFAVFRPSNGTWYVMPNGGGSFFAVQFGLSTDTPAPADYDGDGRSDIAVWRSGATAQFIILQSSTNTAQLVSLGQTGDQPVPADYDGDGRADAAVYRQSNSNWIITRSSDNQITSQAFGLSTDATVAGDFDGDGKFDLAVRRNASNQWFYKQAATGGSTTTLAFTSGFTMQATDLSVTGDYDGDGKTDIAVWRPATGYWYIQRSARNTLRSDQWGQSGDVPIAAPMKR